VKWDPVEFYAVITITTGFVPTLAPHNNTMASMRASTLLRSLPRPGSVPRILSISAAPFRLSPCVRTPSIVHPTASLRPSSRFYSTTPADDIKIYSFTEVLSLSFLLDLPEALLAAFLPPFDRAFLIIDQLGL
jgi:hypothetical protein